MRHIGSKTRSSGLILEKLCVPFRGHIFSLILMKLGQNVWFNLLPDVPISGFSNSAANKDMMLKIWTNGD